MEKKKYKKKKKRKTKQNTLANLQKLRRRTRGQRKHFIPNPNIFDDILQIFQNIFDDILQNLVTYLDLSPSPWGQI